MLPGRTVPPVADRAVVLGFSLAELRRHGVAGPPSVSASAADLALTLTSSGATAAWLRLEPTDRDRQLQRRLVERAVLECAEPPELLVIDDAYLTLGSGVADADAEPTRLILRGDADQRRTQLPQLRSLTASERDMLLLAARLGYGHHELAAVAQLAQQPARWKALVEPLSEGWVRVRPSLRTALEIQLRTGGPVQSGRLHELIAALMARGAAIEAVELCLASDAPGCAADLLSEAADSLVDQGFGATVQQWSKRLGMSEHPGGRVTERPDRLRPFVFARRRGVTGRAPASPAPMGSGDASPQRQQFMQAGRSLTRLLARRPRRFVDVGRSAALPPPSEEPTGGERFVAAEPVPAAIPDLAVRLLGELSVEVGGVPISHWSGYRGRAILRYLATYRRHVIPRDVLVDVFWPEATPEHGRNRLHVTLHALRADLRKVTDTAVIVHRDGGFQLNQDLDVWVDREAFEALLADGRAADGHGDEARARRVYQQALEIYRGDFLEDSPYEEWAVLERETLRIAHLDLLDRLGHLALTASD